MFNRLGVAGAVLQSHPLLTDLLIHESSFCSNIFKAMSIPNRKSQGVDIFRESSSLTMCHMSHVTCHMSRVRCHVSGIMCQVSCVRCHMSIFFPDKVVELVSLGSVINGAYLVQFYKLVWYERTLLQKELYRNGFKKWILLHNISVGFNKDLLHLVKGNTSMFQYFE